MNGWLPYLWIPLGYFIGATPFGYLAGRMKGIDIRQHGSKNIGATNAIRVLGKPIGLTVFALDVIKGWLPAWLACHFASQVEPASLIPVLTAIATVIGHNFTFWLGFKGGKGIATSAGALLPLMPVTILTAFALWCIVVKISKYVSLGSIVAAITLPSSWLVQGIAAGKWWPAPIAFLACAACLMALIRHRENIKRLMNGTENKTGQKKPDAGANPAL